MVGESAAPQAQRVDARWIMAYSAALGETDCRYYNTAAPHGVLAHPLFPVCYEWPLAQPLRDLAALRPLFARLLHAQHDLMLHRPVRAGETLSVSGRIVAVAQRRPGAFVVFRFESRDAAGAPVTTSDAGMLYRGVQIDQARGEVEEPPASAPALSAVGEIHVAATAAHTYTECARIWNPIHTDIAFARAAGLPGLILHGTATLALSVSRALGALGCDPAQVRRVRCRFAGMVPMPTTLSVKGTRNGNEISFETRNEGGEAVITRGSIGLE
ncbi:MAG TPA: MaoC/PaaZ C-terminal domain-containing protein [Burkholderiales bacterium]|nr:MaoC/PaaZ C-terminal domain-containing protein [Burkholderiales bacterium]